MSKKSRERYERKSEYFSYLKESAAAVDPYVRERIDRYCPSSHLHALLLSRYRFGRSQLRPASVRLAFEAVNQQKDWKIAIPVCAGLEMKDTGYYCFDDIVDRGTSPEKLMMMGYEFSVIANRMILELRTSVGHDICSRVLEEILQLDHNTIEGGFVDNAIHKSSTTETQYMERPMCFNFWEHALKIGAIVGEADDETIALLGTIGKRIGMAYIIANDTWDFGKDLEDVQSGRYTLPIIYAMQTSADTADTLKEWMGKPLSDETKNQLRRLMVECGAIEYGKQRAQSYCREAIAFLDNLPNTQARDLLRFSMTMTQRNRYYDLLNQASPGSGSECS